MQISWFVFLFTVVAPLSAQAYSHGTVGIGAGFFSENAVSKISQQESGQTGLLGEPSFPLAVRYDLGLGSSNWFLAPQLMYSLLPRSSAGGTATVSLTHVVFGFGTNLSSSGGSGWDWSIGPGLLIRDIKGKGGTVQMSNGTGTSTFSRPGRSASVKVITTNLGVSWTYGSSRFAADLVLERIMSSSERTQSFMLSYLYQFGGRGF